MMGFGRWLRAQPERFAAVFVVPAALVVLVASLLLPTVASYTRNGPS